MKKNSYIIGFKKLKKYCAMCLAFEWCSYPTYSAEVNNNTHLSKCSEKLCPILKTCKRTDANWYLRKGERNEI